MTTFNEEMIRKHIEEYKIIYIKKFSCNPKSWFSYLGWLSGFSVVGNFNGREIEIAKELLEGN